MAITDVPEFAHLTDADIESLAIELDAIRQDIEDSRGERDSRYIRRTIAAQRALEVAGRLMLAASSQAFGLVGRRRDAGRGQDRREHGDRPQRHARPVGLDERSRDSLLDVGVGHERGVQALAVHPQLHAPQVHQHPRHGRRRRLRRHPRHPRRASGSRSTCTATCCSTPCWRSGSNGASDCSTWSSARSPRAATTGRPRWCACASSASRPATRWPRTTCVSRADVPVARRHIHVDVEGQRGRQRHPQRLDQRGDLLRPLPRRRREVHQDRHGRRDARASGTCGRCSAAPTSRRTRRCAS